MMLTNILIIAWTIGIINYRTSSLPIKCLYPVQKCPIGKEAWTKRNDQYRCTGMETYVCMFDSGGNLFEGCMANFTIESNSGNCPVIIDCIENKPHLGIPGSYFHCPAEESGCPPKDHAGYTIQELYKYPRCSGLKFYDVYTSIHTTSVPSTTMHNNQVQIQDNRHITVIAIVFSGYILLSIIAGCVVVYRRRLNSRPNRQQHDQYILLVPSQIDRRRLNSRPNRQQHMRELLDLLHSINESETGRIQIIPFRTDDTMEMEKIYVAIIIIDENNRYNTPKSDEEISSLTTEEMFCVQSGKLPRFIFMLGDAGFGKTVQCQRIITSWCHARRKFNEAAENQPQLSQLEKRLIQFDLLFFVQMHDVCNEYVDLIDIIADAYSRYHLSEEMVTLMKGVLEDGKFKSLVLLDGLDEWNISDNQKGLLLDKCIPNCRNIPNCTILISMRSWKLIEDERIFNPNVDRVIRLDGLDDDAVKDLAKNMLCNYFKPNTDSDEFHTKYERVINAVSSVPKELKSLLHIPLLAVFYILTLYEDFQTGRSLTTFYLSTIEALIIRSTHDKETVVDLSQSNLTNFLHEYPIVRKYKRQLSFLGRIAFESLTSRNSDLIYSDEHLNVLLGDRETKDFCLRIGLVSKQQATGPTHESNVKIRFLHKTIQEFLASLHVINQGAEDIILSEVSDIEKVLEFSSILTFLSGLSPTFGSTISRHIQTLSSNDKDIHKYREHFTGECFRKVFYLFDLQMKCYREARGTKSIKDFIDDMPECKFEVSDIVLLSQDTDVQTIRESADILRHQANVVKSLYMLCIPDDNTEGITSAELISFLDASDSLESLNIDGNVKGKCRLFDHFIPKPLNLKTIGLWNVASSENTLTDLLTTKEARRNVRVLGLLNITSPTDLDAQFEYQFSSIHMPFNMWYGFLKKPRRSKIKSEELLYSRNAVDTIPVLENILEALPTYQQLSTLFVSYMSSSEDRIALSGVLPKLNSLRKVGYIGSSHDEKYDIGVIKIIFGMKNIRSIDLHGIILKDINFQSMPQIKDILLKSFEMNQDGWKAFNKAISGIETLKKVFLYDTNIDKESFLQLKEVSPKTCTIDKYEVNTGGN